MITVLLGAVCCNLLVYAGGLFQQGHYLLAMLMMAVASISLGALFAMAKLSGFSHFVGAKETGITVGDVYQTMLKDASSIQDVQTELARDLYIQTNDAPVRAGALYTAIVEGKRALVIEQIHLGEADL